MSAWTPPAGPERLSVSRMISSLLGARPAMDAPAAERAVWLDRKAEVFTAIAGVNQAEGDVVNAAEARALALEARGQALTLAGQTAEVTAAGQPQVIARTAGTEISDQVHEQAEIPPGSLFPLSSEVTVYDDAAGLP